MTHDAAVYGKNGLRTWFILRLTKTNETSATRGPTPTSLSHVRKAWHPFSAATNACQASITASTCGTRTTASTLIPGLEAQAGDRHTFTQRELSTRKLPTAIM